MLNKMNFANQITILRIFLTPIFVWLMISNYKLSAFFVFLVASLTDWYDGYVARKYGYSSEFGKFMDPLADKILVLTAFLTFVFLGHVRLWMVIVIFIRDMIITGLRSYAIWRNKPIATSTYAKWKTVSQMVAIYIILVVPTAEDLFEKYRDVRPLFRFLHEIDLLYFAVLGATILTVLTGIHYLYVNRDHLKDLLQRFFKFSYLEEK